jgi:Cof subfamily protein (haloacid dehalogenase superfamily)
MLFAFDLDGTIVTRENAIPLPIQAAILALRQEGHVVTVITGRHRSGTELALEALGVDCHYGTCNGARVHAHGDEHHVELHLDPEVVRQLLERFAADDESRVFLSTRDHMYVRQPPHEGWDWARREGRTLREFSVYDGAGAHKFIVMHENASRLQAELTERFPDNSYFLWEGRYLEVVAPGGHKGNALARIAAEYGVPRAETVAFGDGPNDLEMLRWAGRAVGVGRLAPGVADVIDEHVSGPEELGVADWLERHVLGRGSPPRRVVRVL